ncbi:hypothetical protein MYRNA_73 [Mycobacterium phage Myrna]|uniref:Uncharacterized protein n=1 Tax=Mycobacterium phage Myrna TaxID=546805 RepID=B5LJ84_9CAUD|nr:gp73 [Mycobacterium phage Myrna]ACH62081.1 hypothetical protein MYRNA_73 [Mycobacterium phage Myrna]
MFKNAERDPLAVPMPAQRSSVGPRRQSTAARLAAIQQVESRPQPRTAAVQAPPVPPVMALPSKVARRLQFEAQEFLAQDHGCDDRSELLYRAERHARTQTSTWTPEASQRATQAFVARVAELIPNRPTKVAAAQSPAFEDFDDQLLY